MENKHQIELDKFSEKIKNIEEDKLRLENELKIMKLSMNEMGIERNFYLSKIKDIEILFNVKNKYVQEGKIKDLVNKILYSTKEVEIIIAPDGDVNLKNFE